MKLEPVAGKQMQLQHRKTTLFLLSEVLIRTLKGKTILRRTFSVRRQVLKGVDWYYHYGKNIPP